MTRALLAYCGFALVILGGCGRESREVADSENTTQDGAAQNQTDTVALDEADLPPAIVRSPSYRCDDGKALYVDVLSGKEAVLVRDSRSDIPKRLEREGGNGPFTGDDRSLSGTGSEVRYSSPDRPGQECREGQA